MKFGSCNLSAIPVRAEPVSSSEMTNQLLFGEAFRVVAESGYFVRIETAHDGHSDWIDRRQSGEIDGDAFTRWTETTSWRVASTTATARHHGGREIVLVRGCSLPGWDGESFLSGADRLALSGEAVEVSPPGAVGVPDLLSRADSYLGTPYLWGGRSPFGIDCSGLVQIIYQFFGVPLPRDSVEQARIGSTVASVDGTRTGDLAFFDAAGDEGGSHVGLIVPGGILHASAQVRIDRIDADGIRHSESGELTHHLTGIRRVADVA